MRIALYQPEIAGNVGAILRLGACFATPVEVIEPCGFPFSERAVRRSAMDYADAVELRRHAEWAAFDKAQAAAGRRIVLLTTAGGVRLPDAAFGRDDILLLGSESGGVPPAVHAAAALRVRIPLAAGMRSLNVAVAAGIALAEALRQTRGFPA